jgi:hypothetical protein
MFNAPAVVVWLLALLVLVHVGLSLLPDAQWSTAIETLSLIPARYAGYADQIAGGKVAAVTSFMTETSRIWPSTRPGFSLSEAPSPSGSAPRGSFCSQCFPV